MILYNIIENFTGDEYYQVRQTYKSVANTKAVVNAKEPSSMNLGIKLKLQTAKEKFQDMEHIRRLEAMSKRILSMGKVIN